MFIFMIVFVGIQFIPTTPNQQEDLLQSNFMNSYKVPQEIQQVLKNSCFDCHSNNTNYPWYNRIQPISWFLEQHIKKGKNDLNFDEFESYSIRKQKNKLKSIANQIEENKMPLFSYTLIHKNSKLTEVEKVKLIDWLYKKQDSINNNIK